jgi:hypothetical protein
MGALSFVCLRLLYEKSRAEIQEKRCFVTLCYDFYLHKWDLATNAWRLLLDGDLRAMLAAFCCGGTVAISSPRST